MSDILIRGMEMPGSCAACDFYNVISGRCTRTGTKINFSELTTRSVDCPISELQPHGDLIEVEPIKQFILDGLNRKEFGNDQIQVLTEVEYAPVVIPASK